MMSKRPPASVPRSEAAVLARRLREPRRFLNVVSGPRQAGKTTLVAQVLAQLDRPGVFVSADEPSLRDSAWLVAQWDRARLLAREGGRRGVVLVVDEIQKVIGWSDTVKRLWDEDTRAGLPLRVVLLGSAPVLVQRGLSESLAGRFELLHLPHWSYSEMQSVFGCSLDQYLYFGGYPGAAPLMRDPPRWRRYLLDSLVEPAIARDVLLLTRVDKPALLRRLFELGCRYSGQILSYTKMLGQLHDAGNTTTLAHYLDLLAGAGMVTGLPKFCGSAVRSRGSSPKLQVLNTALLTVHSPHSPAEARADQEFRGRLIESAVGAHLANAAAGGDCELFYWREGNRDVDFVLRAGRVIVGIEVKSSRTPASLPGLAAFSEAFKPKRNLFIGAGGIPLEEFLMRPVTEWLKP